MSEHLATFEVRHGRVVAGPVVRWGEDERAELRAPAPVRVVLPPYVWGKYTPVELGHGLVLLRDAQGEGWGIFSNVQLAAQIASAKPPSL